MNKNNFLVQDLAELLGVKRDAIHYYIRKKRIKPTGKIKTGKNQFCFYFDEKNVNNIYKKYKKGEL